MQTAVLPDAARSEFQSRARIGVRTEDLRKVYASAGPAATPAGMSIMPLGRAQSADKKDKDKKKSAGVVALDGISLQVEPGEIFGLLGPNGAGKSTTVGILTTRVRPTGGRAFIGDYDVWRQPVEARRLIGVVQQRPNLDFALTAREILHFHAAYFGLGPKERARRANDLLERFQLADRADDSARNFSGGMMQRLSIARAMMHDPAVLFLDEPSTGLDPQTRLLLWGIIREYNQAGKTVLLTTHNMEEADALCQRIAIIDHGKLIALGTPAELKTSIPGGYVVRLRFSGTAATLEQRLKQLAGVREVQSNIGGADVYADRGGSLVPELVAALGELQVELTDVHISEPSLENLFLHHTGRSLRD
ncbi:MAG TPA: ATP-binding cassette domain-containing protein [Terriglobales bacterium]|nr:ATP-binding cassette domain-containing protein [Terriglobales bacterium]